MGGTVAARVHRDRIRLFSVGFRSRCRSRRVMRGFTGRAHRPPGGAVRRVVGREQCSFGTFCDFCGHPPGIEAKGAHAKTRRGQWAGSRSGRFRVGGGLARWSAARGGTAKRAGVGLAHAKTQRRKEGKGRRPDAIPCLSWRLCVLSEAGVRNPPEGGVADRWVKKRGICRPAGAGCSWGDGTQRSRAGLSSGGPPGLVPRLEKRGNNVRCATATQGLRRFSKRVPGSSEMPCLSGFDPIPSVA